MDMDVTKFRIVIRIRNVYSGYPLPFKNMGLESDTPQFLSRYKVRSITDRNRYTARVEDFRRTRFDCHINRALLVNKHVGRQHR